MLELPRVTKVMEGTYTCTAKYKEISTSSSAALSVYGKFHKKRLLLISMKMNMKMKMLEIYVETKIKTKVTVVVRKEGGRSSRVVQLNCFQTTHNFNYELMCTDKNTRRCSRYIILRVYVEPI